MVVSNNRNILSKNFVKIFSHKDRFLREKYFYMMYKRKKINIPKVIRFGNNLIEFKKYNFKKFNSQTIFFEEFLKFLIKLNSGDKSYKLNAKENLKSYNDLKTQVIIRYEKLNNKKFEKKFQKKLNIVLKYIKTIIENNPNKIQIENKLKIISPSDVGVHNYAKYNNKFIFYDFEYAGLDNPIKLICDLYYQPEANIKKKNMLKFIYEFERNFKFKIPKNFIYFEKLFRVKMILIILNVFLGSNITRKLKSSFTNKKIDYIKMQRLNKSLKYISKPYISN